MVVKNAKSGHLVEVNVIKLNKTGLRRLTKKQFWFNWLEESGFDVYALTVVNTGDIIGAISLDDHPAESRIEIRLLAALRKNVGKHKEYDGIVGDLIAFTCVESLKKYGEWACVSLIPKTEMRTHYVQRYGMYEAGISLGLDGKEMTDLITEFF